MPLGDSLVLFGDIYYEHERDREHGLLHVAVRVDGELVGRLVHADGEGGGSASWPPPSAPAAARAWPGLHRGERAEPPPALDVLGRDHAPGGG
ncbi:MAG: hypothetical protein M5U28_05545 [Sandaracinaceae bacterium]|nr:hypothetical protein [Sandaracinaceae bacterium]